MADDRHIRGCDYVPNPSVGHDEWRSRVEQDEPRLVGLPDSTVKIWSNLQYVKDIAEIAQQRLFEHPEAIGAAEDAVFLAIVAIGEVGAPPELARPTLVVRHAFDVMAGVAPIPRDASPDRACLLAALKEIEHYSRASRVEDSGLMVCDVLSADMTGMSILHTVKDSGLMLCDALHGLARHAGKCDPVCVVTEESTPRMLRLAQKALTTWRTSRPGRPKKGDERLDRDGPPQKFVDAAELLGLFALCHSAVAAARVWDRRPRRQRPPETV